MFITSEKTNRHFTLSITLIFALNFFFVSHTFPISQLATSEFLATIDSIFHWYNIVLAGNIAQSDNLIGYDPFFDAGRPAGLAYSASSQFPALIYILLGRIIDAAVIWKFFTFCTPIISFLLFILSARLFGLKNKEIIVASIIGLCLLWVSLIRWQHTVGMVAFEFSGYASVFYVSLFIYVMENRNQWRWIFLTAVSGAIFEIVHPLFFLTASVGISSYILIKFRNIDFVKLFKLSVACILISFIFNYFWIYGLFVDLSYSFAPPHEFQRVVDLNLIWKQALGIWEYSQGSKVNLLIVFGTVAALIAIRRIQMPPQTLTFIVGGCLIIVYAAIGAGSETLGALTQPNRFAPVGYLFLAMPAAVGLVWLANMSFVPQEGVSGVWIARAGTMMVAALSLVVFNEVRQEVFNRSGAHYGRAPPEVRGLGPYTNFMALWINANTSGDARILFETSSARIHDGTHVAGYLAGKTRREFIGGPYPENFITGSSDGKFFGKAISELPPSQMKHYIERYNIGWIIVHHASSKKYFDQISWVSKQGEFEKIRIYKVKRNFSYFLEGSGRVSDRKHNYLSFSDVEGDEIILKYHFVSGLYTVPKRKIVPYKIDGDKNAFIRIINPPESFYISMGKN